jgi:hypothetical protein
VASLLAAGALAIGLSAGVAGASGGQTAVRLGADVVAPAAGGARTAVQIPTGAWVELWMPYITPGRPKCLDIPPDGGPFGHVVLYSQIFPCHASDGHGDNQLWQFVPLGNGSYWIVNKYYGGWCLVGGSGLNSCTGTVAQWHVIPSAYDPNGFLLSNDYSGDCIGSDTAIPTGNNSKRTRLWGCSNPAFFNSNVQIMTWRLG